MTLNRWGINVSGSVVLARYGEVFRGNIAHNEYNSGVVGVVTYTDREDYDNVGEGRVFPDDMWLLRVWILVLFDLVM